MRNVRKLAAAWLALNLLTCGDATAEDIKTTEGQVYKDVMVFRAEPDGILINYKPDGGGFGTAKVKFASLPENIQREYGFDPLKATAFEASQAKAQGVLQAKMQADYKDATNRLAKRLAKEDEEWQAEQAVAQAKLRAEQAAAQAKLFAEQMAAEEKLAVQAALAGGTAWLAENGNPYSEVSVRTPESIAQAQQIQQWSPAAAQGDVQAAANLAQAKAAATQGFTPGEADIEWRRQQAGYVPNQYQPPGANGLFPNRPAQSGPLPASGNAAPTAGRK